MAISANAVTIAQAALTSREPVINAVGNSLLDNGSVLARDIPMVNRQLMIANGVRWVGNLPTVNWAKVNEEGATSSGTPTPYQEQAFIIRNYVDVDEVLLRQENNLVDPRATQTEATLRAIAYDFNHKFIENNHTTGDSDAFLGMRWRLDNPGDFQIPTVNKIDASATMTTSMTAANMNALLEKLDQGLYAVDSADGEGVVIYCNEVFLRRFAFGLRLMGTSGGLRTDQDQYGRIVSMYKGAQLRDIGLKADQATRIIKTTEANTGADGSSTFTSVYLVNYRTDHMFGWQYAPIEVRPVPGQDNAVINRTLVQWVGGLYQANIRSIARLYDINLG